MYDWYVTLINMTRNEEVAREAVRKARDELTWTNRQLAEKAGVNYDTVNDFLIRDTWPRPVTQERIETALGWPTGRIEELASQGERQGNGRRPIPRTGESPSASGQQPSALVNWLSPEELERLTEREKDEIEAKARGIALEAFRQISSGKPKT